MTIYLPEIWAAAGAGVLAPEILNTGAGALLVGVGLVFGFAVVVLVGRFLTGVALNLLGSYFLFFWKKAVPSL
jgi:hypothetical protein